jgi:hypothetical protein
VDRSLVTRCGAGLSFNHCTLPCRTPHQTEEGERNDRITQINHDDLEAVPSFHPCKNLRLLSCDTQRDTLPVTRACPVAVPPSEPNQRAMMSSLPAPSASSSTLAPTTRSRTLLFISYRDSSARAPRRSRGGRQYEDSYYQPSDENEGLIDHQTVPHTSLDVELPPKWFVSSERTYSRAFPICLLLNKKNQGGLR